MNTLMERETLESMLAESPFHRVLGLRLGALDAERQRLSIDLQSNSSVERAVGTGQYHGGVIASLIDIAGDFALIWQLGFGVPTINFRTDYLRPAFGDSLSAEALVRRIGRTVGVVDIEVTDTEQRLVAVGRGCYGTRQG